MDEVQEDNERRPRPAAAAAPQPPSPMRRCCSNTALMLRQFFLLLGKNFLLQFRRPIVSCFELLVPVAAVSILVIFRFAIPSLGTSKQCYTSFGTDQLTIPAIPGIVYYAPNNTQEVGDIVNILKDKLEESQVLLVGMATQEEFITRIHNESQSYPTSNCMNNGIGIYFEDVNHTDIVYSIRTSENYEYNVEDISPAFELTGARTENLYLSSGFMQLQKVIDESIIQWKTNTPFSSDVNVRQFPFPDYNQNFFLQALQTILPLLMVLSLMFSVGIFVKELVQEKDSRMKETMRMMGLSNWTLISSWFVKQVLFYLPAMVAMVILLKYGKIYPQSNLFLLFVLILLYFMTAVAFTFLISVWFTSAWLGLFAGFIIWFVLFIPYFFIQPRYATMSFGLKMGTGLLSNICMGYAIQILTTLEVQDSGLQFDNIATSVSITDNLNIAWLMLMMVVDIVLYMSLYWYIDAIKPGKYGTPKPFYFPFIPSFWLGNIARRKIKPKDIEYMTNPVYDAAAHEEDPDLEVGISINRLTKIFGGLFTKKKVAVDNLSLNMYKGQVTALLGHNGAGKTTTMSVLTGLYTPTTGNAYINGYSVLNEMDLVRRSLGICPQHNVLFDQLTVYEHLYFFSLLKGTPANQVKDEVNRMIADLQLSDKRKTLAKKLSGGMKRKLSVGIALIGQSEIVILDEPTSGMDPYARRATWDLLIKHKEGRTILLTTHFMDEADVLGDRIAIMVEGQLRCSGSPLFLKSKFGVGYHMIVVKAPGCDSRKVISVVRGMIEGSKEVTDVGAELSFILPTHSKGKFPELFDVMERDKEELGISSFGVSITTMEEVFIKVGQGDDFTLDSKLKRSRSRVDQSLSLTTTSMAAQMQPLEEGDTRKQDGNASPPSLAMNPTTNYNGSKLNEEVSLLNDETNKASCIDMRILSNEHQYGSTVMPAAPAYRSNRGIILWFQQLYAVFIKHFLHAIRFWPSVIWQLLIPIAFVVFSIILAITNPSSNSDNNPSRLLTLRNTAPTSTIKFFQASLNGASFPYQFKSNETRAVGISELSDFTDNINEIRAQVANITNIEDCCSYSYQILDKFCASRTLNEYTTQCRSVESFSFNPCIECLRCSVFKSSSCTNPAAYSYYQECPVSPTLSFNDLYEGGNLIGPLDGYDTYIAEKLLRDSGKFTNPNSFFRVYQGGFVIHPESPVYSACGTDRSELCQSLSPTLDYNYPPNNVTDFIEKSEDLLQYYSPTVCENRLFNLSNPSCSSSNWNNQYNWAVDTCIDFDDCDNSGGDVTQCLNQYVSSVSEPEVNTQPPKITIWYNNQPYHSAPAVLNSFYSLHLQHATGNTITVKNHPLPKRIDEQVDDLSFNNAVFGYSLSYIAVFGTCFMFSSFVISLIQEKQTKAKHIQFVSGVGSTSYWLGTYLYDMINALIPTICIVIVFAAFNVEGFKNENLAAIFLLFLLSTWAAIPISYIFSFLFNNSLIAFALLIVFHYFVFFVFILTIALVSPSDAKILYYIFLLHPTFGLGNGLSDMYINQVNKAGCTKSPAFEHRCQEAGITYIDSIFSFDRPGINWTFIYLAVEGVVLFILAVLIERGLFIREIFSLLGVGKSNEQTSAYGSLSTVSPPPYEDEDVAAERQKVMSREELQDTDVVVIRDIRKIYKGVFSFFFPCVPSCQNQYKTAVDGVNLVIPTGECFGLLGVNGAGKTTTFNMLTGDTLPTSGTANIAGYDIRTQLHEVQKRIGYCPQFDAIIELLTGRELLTMFGRLRGIPERMIKEAVQFEINRLDLSKHADKKCGTYSGGNKRKLSTAVALIGNPPIIFLDEPTTGMDPVTRRFLWDSLLNIVSEGRSVIITSHSMEECEALCSRLAIMVNGKFKCLGSTQHLKSKFGRGYSMQIKVSQQFLMNPPPSEVAARPMGQPTLQTSSPAMAAIKGFIHQEFPNSHIEEEHQNTIAYQIPTEGVTWSSMFRKIEENKDRLGIEDYSISQTTLDQIFINFAKEQEGGIDVLYS